MNKLINLTDRALDWLLDALFDFLGPRLPPCTVCSFLRGFLAGACTAVALTALVLVCRA